MESEQTAVAFGYTVKFDATSALFEASRIELKPGWLCAFGKWDFAGIDDPREWRAWPSARVIEVKGKSG